MGPYLGTYFIGLNLQRPPFADNPDLRLALSLAIDRDALAQQVMHGAQAPAYGLVPPGTAGYVPQSPQWAATPIEERRALAREIFARATQGRSEPIRLRIIYGSSQLVRSVLVAVAAMWKQAFGVQVEIVSEEFRVYLQTQRDPNRWEALRMAWVADYNDASTFLELFRQGNPSNVFGYASPRFDAVLERAQRTPDLSARAELLQEAERMLLAEHAFIPLFHMRAKRLVSPRVEGFQVTPLNRIYSRHLRLRD
jgi:oligopeptide transport system substrate-binding protein